MLCNTLLSIAATASLVLEAQAQGVPGITTRFNDCCKPSCAWSGKADVTAPVKSCGKDDAIINDPMAKSGCEGGPAYSCSAYQPWTDSQNDKVAWGFAATNLGSEAVSCCSCYKLTFTSGPVQGKTMVVQSINIGYDLASNQFDLLIPGGGVGLFDGCKNQYSASFPGQRYGGLTALNQCSALPKALQAGCRWRYGSWFQDANNPNMVFERVQCPAVLTGKTGCKRPDDPKYPVFDPAKI